jgi:CheY-like chemotaxis protein
MIMRNTLKILVVDDDAIVRTVHSRMLNQAGHQVMQAKNGKEAVNLFHEHSFDAVLMDINMPLMNGIEATAQIRSHEAPAKLHTPIIGVTGYDSEAHANCLAKGMDKVLSKPVNADELLCTLQQVVQVA